MPAPGFLTARASNSAQEKLAMDRDNVDLIGRPVHHSEIIRVRASKTRPADVLAYPAGGLVGAAADVLYTFDLNALGLPRGGLIVGATLVRNATGNAGTRFRAHIHNAVPPTFTNADRAAHPLLWANRAGRCGWIDFSSPNVGDAASGNDCQVYAGVLSNSQGIACDPTDGIIRALLTTRDAIATSDSAAAHDLELAIIL